MADTLGFRNVSSGSCNGRVAVGSRAELVARALADVPGRPPLDARAVAWLGYTVLPAEGRTGFNGVSLLPQGAQIAFTGSEAQPRVVSGHGRPWGELDRDQPASLSSAVRTVRSSTRLHLEGLDQAFPSAPLAVDLTGGKDSRLVAALGGDHVDARSLSYRTVGSDQLMDVVVAREVARELGLQWENGMFFHPPEPAPYRERFARFVRVTGGMVGAWSLVNPPGQRDQVVRVSGLNGECLRTHRQISREIETEQDLLALRSGALKVGTADLFRARYREEFSNELTRSLLEDPFQLDHPLDKLESYFIRHRARGRYGPLEDLSGLATTARVLPLYTTSAIAAALSLGPHARRQERLHLEIIRARSQALAEIPFAGSSWPAEIGVTTSDLPIPPGGSGPDGGDISFMRQAREQQIDELIVVLREIFSDDQNPAWEYIDRAIVLESLRNLPGLAMPAKHELFGAATAVAWLSDDFVW